MESRHFVRVIGARMMGTIVTGTISAIGCLVYVGAIGVPVLANATPDSANAPIVELTDLHLTLQQHDQLMQITQETRSQLQTVLPKIELTLEQQLRLRTGQPIQMPLPEITAEQKVKLQQVMQAYMQRVEAILTPEQKQQFWQKLRSSPNSYGGLLDI